MVTIRGTKKLLARMGSPASEESEPTTRLGDWHAKPVAIGHQRFILLVSARSRLPVLMWARDVKHFANKHHATQAWLVRASPRLTQHLLVEVKPHIGSGAESF